MSYSKAKLSLFGHLMPTFALFLILVPGASLARHLFNQDCGSVFCGSLNISYPLRLKNQPPQCGCHDLELECENNNRTTLVLREGKFYVQKLFYENETIQLVDSSLEKDDCNSLPLSSVNTVLNLNQACTVEAEVPIMVKSISGMSTLAIYNKLSDGFYLSWHQISV
ncbi:hypothetical protein Golob_020826 [Gossypium lobatum]|uniref:Wall-associated receptor kinase galacturonan-binding domain-containing protein n=1 Tax=Gossypium lobatum TaxID=34289 RepID=A0A7J8LBM3_9ROSI|nr:hypothetical protein [Gossypium lobatum]